MASEEKMAQSERKELDGDETGGNELDELDFGNSDDMEEDFKRLVSQGNSASSLLSANCFEFDKYQWETVVYDHSNKEIAIAMKTQGETRYDNAAVIEDKVTQQQLYEKGILYTTLRQALIERLEKGFEAKRERNPKLSVIFPPYVPPPIVEIKINVTCQVMNAAPKTKKVVIKREEGLATAIRKAKEMHKGLPLKNEYEFINPTTNEVVTEEEFATIEEGNELKLQEKKEPPAAKGKVPVSKSSASSKKAAPAPAAPSVGQVNATVTQRRLENSIRLVSEDVNSMIIPISSNAKFHEKMSLLAYMTYWGAYVLNGLNGLLKDMKSGLVEISRRESLDCLISIQRCLKDLRSICPPTLIADAENIEKKLIEKFQAMNMNLLTLVSEDYPELIDKSAYDYNTPKLNRLYKEQAKVLDILHEKISSDQSCMIGYRVPPSGGKTILSVAVAAMISKYHRNAKKRLLYICYNTLVRMSVANACEQALIPFWVASTRTQAVKVGGGRSAVITSFSCRDRSRAAMRKRRQEAKDAGDGSHKLGDLFDMMEKAESETVKWNPIIIADITSAYELLKRDPDNYIVYLDEPTAGAENGIGVNEADKNNMQEFVAKIITILPRQAVLLSATLPNLKTELPALSYRQDDIIMVQTERLPVGCVAVGPNGNQVLPHEISASLIEFRSVVQGLQTDALMQRFYTPGPVYKLAKVVEKVCASILPPELKFENVLRVIGDISHATIRKYAVDLLTWIANLEDETLGQKCFDGIKNMAAIKGPKPVEADNFVVEHVASEGRALAVTTTYSATHQSDSVSASASASAESTSIGRTYQSLEELIAKAMSPYIEKIPDIHEHLKAYDAAKLEYARKKESLSKAKKNREKVKTARGDKDAPLGENDYREDAADGGSRGGGGGGGDDYDQLSEPQFGWPIQIAGFSAMLSDEELKILDGRTCSNLLSGLGEYNPGKMTSFERNVVMREAGHGHLACLFSSPDIVYGTNMALITVFIGEGYGHIATRNSLYQLIGRAGRTGKSHKAKILFQDEETMKKALLPEPEGKNFEAEVMNWHVNKILSAK